MSASVHARVIRQALELAGGPERLARHLGRSRAELNSWLTGQDIPRASVFFTLLDIATRRQGVKGRGP